ncbi:hypothetical protein ACE01N_07165 [Saccharicrinis sp. FJH2]|uniref:hypothetical protein n=1 Tax=Saccharicrinis sp. FJH65 TaxID=3344659 RepID=UPI0035F34554
MNLFTLSQRPYIRKAKKFLLYSFLLFVVEGCWAPKLVITSANVTQPVMVGNIRTIGGKQQIDTLQYSRSEFTANIQNFDYFWSAVYVYGYSTLNEGSNKIDAQLLPMIDTGDSYVSLRINSVDFNVAGGYWLFVYSSYTKGKLKGTVSYPFMKD